MLLFRLQFKAVALAITGLLALGALENASAQQKKIPFRAKQDGTVNYDDLLKLTRQGAARDSITDDELAAIKSKHKIKYNELFKPTGVPIAPPRKDLYASSLILSDGVNHTLLPKRAVVFLPEKYQRRVVDEPIGELILWPEFQKINATWVKTLEVTLPVAKGDEPIAEPVRKQFELGFHVIVSVYRKSPISLMPLKEPAEAGDAKEVTSRSSATDRTGRRS
jgi:hypothetical protein